MGVGPGEVRVRESGRLLLTEGSVEGPNDQVVYSFRTADDMEGTHDQTEGFQERVEPPIIDLESALGCEPSEDAISLTELFTAWPAGTYEFEGESGEVEFEGTAKLTHRIPAGPRITAPEDGDVVPHDAPLLVPWKKVTGPMLPVWDRSRSWATTLSWSTLPCRRCRRGN